MQRKLFLQFISAGSMGILVAPSLVYSMVSEKKIKGIQHTFLKITQNSSLDIPSCNRLPFGWSAIGISPNETILVKPEEKLPETNLWIRISVAQEIWDEKLLHISIPGTGMYLGAIDIRFSSVLVPYELEIPKKHVWQINEQGLELKLESKSPLWIFSEPGSNTDNTAFLPQIVSSPEKKGDVNELLRCFMSVNSIQSFGWREGCVLDGLWQIYSCRGDERALETIRHILIYFLTMLNIWYTKHRRVFRMIIRLMGSSLLSRMQLWPELMPVTRY